jgi:parvulin-like peptidyl-prolyl isomerase
MMRRVPRTVCHLCLIGLTAAVTACDSDKVQPVMPQDFYARHTSAVTPISPLDRPGVIPLPDSHSQAPPTPPGSSDAAAEPTENDLRPLPSASPPATMPGISFAVPSTQPTTQPSMASDQYMTLGNVVIVVNGTPIFANKVLRLDVDILRGYAKQMDIIRFEDAARSQIERTVEQQTDDELEVAAAERTLDPKDIQLARALTTLWSQNQIAQAGGSEQVVRLRAHASGEDFEDQERDMYRRYLQELYYWKKISPEINITAEDERRYYRAHLDQFTTPTQASIILIEASPDRLDGDAAAAKSRLWKIRQRAAAGEDFADYGRRQNDLPGATGDQGTGGQMTIKPNTLVLSKVEAEIWKTPPGQISDVIEDNGDFYIFKVLTRDQGGTKSFADRAVQEAITKRLSDIQRIQRRDAELLKLRTEAICSPENLESVVEMAKQNYPQWSKQ